jgi:hypothetical protein
MGPTFQLVLVLFVVAAAVFYVGRHIRKQIRRPDADFSGREHDCGTCPIAPENLPPPDPSRRERD